MRKTIIGIALASFAIGLLLAGPIAMAIWLLTATFFGLREYYDIHKSNSIRPLPLLGVPLGCSFIILALLSIYLDGKILGPQAYLLIIVSIVLGSLVYQFCYAARGKKSITTAEISVTLFGSVYVGGLLSFILLVWGLGIQYFPGDMVKINLCVFLPFWAAYGSDSAAFLVGSKFGKHKMFPRVSPNKTIEGSLGALTFCVVGTVVAGSFLGYSIPALIGIGLVAGIASQVGDHCESVFKREHEVKDSGSTFGKTHGGFLDKMDSIVFTLPVYYYFLYLCRPPLASGG
ncbi:MAG TPA: phosphatidate cytidylyltransferase [bacterium]|nr:phosphatidate cytidylyltransferase [bacterium]